jgi:type I restriction enzyme M protein
LDDLEQGRAMEAELVGKPYAFIIDPAHKWSKWAAPKKANGAFDHDNGARALDAHGSRWPCRI